MKKQINPFVAATIGNTLEFYNFTLFGFLVPLFSPLFFPSDNLFISALYGYMAFAVGYICEPIGAILWGHIGDRLGRKVALYSSLYLMGFSSLLIGVLPSHSTLGIFSTLLIILARILQGISSGGERAGGLLFALEHTQDNKKGWIGGLLNAISTSGIFLGSLAGYICTLPFVPIWSWRIAFILGFFISIFGLYSRSRVTETPVFTSIPKKEINKFPLLEGIKTYYGRFLLILLITGFPTIAFHMNFIFLPMYFKTLPGITESYARFSGTFSLCCLTFLLPLFGYLSDKLGRAKIMNLGAGILFIFGVLLPYFFNHLTPTKILAGQVIFAIILSMFNGPWCAFATEVFDKKFRYSCLGAGNTLGISIFGSTTPIVGAWLTHIENGTSLLANYITLASIIGFLGVMSLNILIASDKNRIKNNPILSAQHL